MESKVLGAHTCNPSYSKGKDQLRANNSARPCLFVEGFLFTKKVWGSDSR
jgi:hypothetical protein